MGKQTKHFHYRALLAIETALSHQDKTIAWLDLQYVLKARLTPYERSCLLASAALSNEPDLLFEVLEVVVPARLLGTPLPVAFEIEDEARWWAKRASLPELTAWSTACFVRLPAKDQTDFLVAAKRRKAA